MVFNPSNYQRRIFSFISQADGSAAVKAVAGAGKTTTLVEAAKLLPSGDALFVAFNKHIADTLKVRLAGTRMVSRTVHSIGWACLARQWDSEPQLDEDKYWRLIRAWVKGERPQLLEREAEDLVANGIKLINLVRLTLTNPANETDIHSLIWHYGIDIFDSGFIAAVDRILAQGAKTSQETYKVDFTDMIWLPAYWNLYSRKVDWVFVDEAQDLSAAQLALIRKCLKPNSRVLAVGDPNQAIYGFAGADTRSFERVKAGIGAVELPLSICYRCPQSHIRLAQEIVPEIEPSPNAPAGLVTKESEGHLSKLVQKGDIILSRKTTPLVDSCIKLIQQGISAQVRGRDIGKDLSILIERVARQPDFHFDDFIEFVDLFEERQLKRLKQRENNMTQIQSLQDRCETLRVCYLGFDAGTLEELQFAIENLFTDNQPDVWFSTVHRAKGLEADRVFILRPNDMPLTWEGQMPWEFQQEMNLFYVALTRSKHFLCFLEH
ncbi:MAG: hypothetical protein DPW16_02055 [Chloroflexi bacterium]|nr:hypothetical protein [Chloroflexota bacterium]